MTSGRPVRCTSTPLRLATRLHRSPPARAGLSLSRTGRGARGELAASTSRASGFPSVPSVARRISSRLADYSMAVAACWEESTWLNPLAIRPARRLVWWSGPRSRCDPVAAGTCRAAWPSSFGVVAHEPRKMGVVGHMPRGPAAVVWGLWPTCPDTRGSWPTCRMSGTDIRSTKSGKVAAVASDA